MKCREAFLLMYIGYILHCQAPIEKVFRISMSLPLLLHTNNQFQVDKGKMYVSTLSCLPADSIINKIYKISFSLSKRKLYQPQRNCIKSDIFIREKKDCNNNMIQKLFLCKKYFNGSLFSGNATQYFFELSIF